MKILFDLFPVILFFLSFKIADANPDAAWQLVSSALGTGVSPDQAPVICATAVAIVASVCQVALVLLRGKKVELMLWLSLVIVVIFGSLTIWLHNPLFIKWKPTILYWLFGAILLYGTLTGRNFIRKLMGDQLELPVEVWHTLQKSWIGFFLSVGILNLIVAYTCSTSVWVNFKLFGLVGITLVFTLLIGFYIMKKSPESLETDKKN